ncbi:uncharacterized protein LOC109195371 isoform X1 [Oreochromis niloticus]|uniref:uncharacterized protein LOC109195371 isoform X1 n=1 Tax=Oreochromis niloticus TaxID=8128 RepID=UPI000393CE45|nr:uncharacterized protein LOC109195371 isoform X1 [Oreochromis niloticus]XP_025756390.1 uncharacterized protein LOC109195371 isoform X1 [Oreochromis niloticus]CAI5641979.1 unnamed protein product [Mustela putorius furo]
MDSGDGEINGANQNVGLRFCPLLHLVEQYEQYDAVRQEMSVLRACIMAGFFDEDRLETAIQFFNDILWLGNIQADAGVDHIALSMLEAGIGINVAAEGPWDNEALPVPAADMENNLAEDPWDHRDLPLQAANVDINLPQEADQLADEMWWIWESDTDSGSENESDNELSDTTSESEDDENEDTVPSPSISNYAEAGQKKRKRDDDEEDNGRDRKCVKTSKN